MRNRARSGLSGESGRYSKYNGAVPSEAVGTELDALLHALRECDALRDVESDGQADVVELRTEPRREPIFSDSPLIGLPRFLLDALNAQGIARLYRHQTDAIADAMKGDDIVLESPTASGKTLCFNIPLLLRLLCDPSSHGLMIHPMKALSNDQRRQFEQLTVGLRDLPGRKIESWLYDGDTLKDHRDALRQNPPAVLLTNPDMLHMSFLGWAEQWESFLRNLRIVIIDEMHEYRGFFGTNTALLLRRFFNKLEDLGARPQIILATATWANPLEHAQRLTGRSGFVPVRSADHMRPTRHFAFINPRIPDYQFLDIYRLRIARASLATLRQNLTTVVFCPSRMFAESACKLARRDAEQYSLDKNMIVPYRAGYSADDRREIEEGLRTGKYRVVFSTNALEIGIDIGRLDCCILAGFPDNVMSAWQRIGRAGRGWDKTAFVLFYAMNSAMDQFFASNIDSFLNKPLDEIIIGVDNEELMTRHTPYLLHESGWNLNEGRKQIVGDVFWQHATGKASSIRRITGHKPPYARLDIRGASGAISKLIRGGPGGEQIGTISDFHLFREAYVGAIYNHRGETFRVTAHGGGEAYLETAEAYLKTQARFFTVVQGTEILRGFRHVEAVVTCYGKVTIYDNFTGYKLINDQTGATVDDVPASNALRKCVRGFWIGIEPANPLPLVDVQARLRVLEQFIRIGSPFIIPCDRHDLATLTSTDPIPSVYLYETVPGGFGIAEKMLSVWREVVERGIRLAQECPCKDGCPRCIHPPRYLAADAGALRKCDGFPFAEQILAISKTSATEEFDPDTQGWRQRQPAQM